MGDIFTANINASGHLEKVNRIFSWANYSGTDVCKDSGNLERLKLTRNNQTVVGGVKFAHAIENVDTCDGAACLAAYNANKDAFADLSAAEEDYLYDAIIGDYADGDTTHAGDKAHSYKVIDKWNAICAAAGATPSQKIVLFNDNKMWIIITIASATAMISLAGLFFALRRRRVAK